MTQDIVIGIIGFIALVNFIELIRRLLKPPIKRIETKERITFRDKDNYLINTYKK